LSSHWDKGIGNQDTLGVGRVEFFEV